MSRNSLLNVLAVLVCVIATLHLTATAYSLYWTLWWYDMILHFLGGVFSGLLALWYRFFSGYVGSPSIPSARAVFGFVIVSVLTIGIGWEAFERVLGHTWSVEGYYLDTAVDLVLDLFGGLLAFALFLALHRTNEVRA